MGDEARGPANRVERRVMPQHPCQDQPPCLEASTVPFPLYQRVSRSLRDMVAPGPQL